MRDHAVDRNKNTAQKPRRVVRSVDTDSPEYKRMSAELIQKAEEYDAAIATLIQECSSLGS